MPTDEAYVQLLSLAVHEFRTPANVVSGYLRMLAGEHVSLGEPERRLVDGADRSCQNLLSLIADLSDIQKLDAGLLPMTHARVEIFPLLQAIVNGLDTGRDDVQLELRGALEGAALLGDSARLGRAIGDLTRGVVRGLAPGSTAVMACQLDRHQAPVARIILADAEVLEGADNASPAPFDEMRGGLGLSLPLARRVIERHGGRVWAPAGQSESKAAIVSLPVV